MLLVMLVTGTAFSQLPEFAQQYRQRLGGAIDALEGVLDDFKQDAAQYGLSFQDAIARQKTSGDPFIQARGFSMVAADERLTNLKKQRDEFETAAPIQRLMVFFRGVDRELVRATAEDYVPAMPVSGIGFLSACFGAIAGLIVARILLSVGNLGRRRRRPT